MVYKFNFQDDLYLPTAIEKRILRHIFWYRVKRILKKILNASLVITGMLLALGVVGWFIVYHRHFTL